MMRIGIIGGGAIGLLIASYVKEKYKVEVITRREEQAEILSKNGVVRLKDGVELNRVVQAYEIHKNINEFDIVFIAVKQYNINEIQYILNGITANSMIFLQNGIGHLHNVEEIKSENISVGIVEHGAMKLEDNVVEHTGIGRIRIGNVRGEIKNLDEIFSNDDFEIVYELDWESTVLNKLMINAIVNPLTAIYRVKNGELLSNKYYNRLMVNVFEEIYSVLEIGNKEEVLDNIKLICEKTSNNKSSMLRDLENKNQTEIDSILGYILNIAKEKQINTPLTTFLYYSIKGIEESFAFDNKLDYNLN